MDARTPMAAVGILAILAFMIVPFAAVAEEASASDEFLPTAGPTTAALRGDPKEAPGFDPPKLLYLAWQEDGIHSTGKAIEHILWDADGRIVSGEKGKEILERVKSFDVHWRREGYVHSLVLVFAVDERLEPPAPVMATVLADDGSRHATGSAANRPSGGMIVSAVAPSKRTFPQWPADITLEISYPVENLTVIKTLTEIPDEPVEIDPGVTWYLDPSRAVEAHPETRELIRAQDKTAAVLQKRRDPEAQATYRARVYLRGRDEPIRNAYSTIIEPEETLHEIDVSETFAGQEEIEKVEFLRQRRASRVLENVPLLPELLPPYER